MSERVPAARASLCGRVGWIKLEESAHGRIVPENCRRMDTAASDFRMRRQDRLSLIERAVPDTGVDERRQWIAYFSHGDHPSSLVVKPKARGAACGRRISNYSWFVVSGQSSVVSCLIAHFAFRIPHSIFGFVQ